MSDYPKMPDLNLVRGADEAAFNTWWLSEGSCLMPLADEHPIPHAYRISKSAWLNGAKKAREDAE